MYLYDASPVNDPRAGVSKPRMQGREALPVFFSALYQSSSFRNAALTRASAALMP